MVYVRQTFKLWRLGWVNYFTRPRRVALGTALVVGLLLMVMVQLASKVFISRQLNNDRQQVSAEMMGFGNALAISLQHRVALLEGLEAFVTAELNSPQATIQPSDFEAVAASLYQSTGGIRYFALAPGGVQRFVYPPAANAGALQHDLLADKRPQVANQCRRLSSRAGLPSAVSTRWNRGARGCSSPGLFTRTTSSGAWR